MQPPPLTPSQVLFVWASSQLSDRKSWKPKQTGSFLGEPIKAFFTWKAGKPQNTPFIPKYFLSLTFL
jgi:hypothetical protein